MRSSSDFDPRDRQPWPLAREAARLISGELDGDPEGRLRLEVAVAEDVRRHLVAWGRSEPPARPYELPDDDRALLSRLRVASGSRNPDDAALVAAFGLWRYAVWQVEERDAARVDTVIWALGIYERILASYDDPQVRAARDQVQVFLRSAWGAPAELPSGYLERRELCARLARRPDVMPSWLGAMRDPRDDDGEVG